MELPYDVIEHILERLDVKALLKFKLVSKQWNSTIESRWFQKRQLIHRKQSGNPDVLFVSVCDKSYSIEAMRTLVLGSSAADQIQTPWEGTLYEVANNSCDGLICLNDALLSNPNMVVNPTTRWIRRFPYSTYQLLRMRRKLKPWQKSNLGFGKDIVNGTFKPVWLYNSHELCLENKNKNNNAATVCEVYDFSIDAWRLVVHESPYPILPCQHPVYVDGSLHWLTTKAETMVLCFDLHHESFQVIKSPFLYDLDSYKVFGMCTLDDRLCVFEEQWGNQVIWSFDSEHKTWKKIYSINIITITSSIDTYCTVKPLAVVDKEKLLMVCGADFGVELVIYDPKIKTCELAYTSEDHITADRLCYFQSLISIV